MRVDSAFPGSDWSSSPAGINQVLGEQPTPEFAAMVAENCAWLLARLDDETLKEVALLKLDGYTNDEIAEELGYTTRTVERKLARIRQKWEREDEP